MCKKNILLICGTRLSSDKNGKTNYDLIIKAKKCLKTTKCDYIILSGKLNHRAEKWQINIAKRDKIYRECYDLRKLMKQHLENEWAELKNKVMPERKARDTIGNFFYSFFLMKDKKINITKENLIVIPNFYTWFFKKFFLSVIENKRGWSWFYLWLISLGLMFKCYGLRKIRIDLLDKIRKSDKITENLIDDYTNKISLYKI